MTKSEEQLRGEREQLHTRVGFDVIDLLPRIVCPTLVQAGTFDGVAPPANGRLIASLIPGAEYREYDGGHHIDLQDRRAMADRIAFLAA